MKKKISFAYVFTIAGAIGFGVVCLLGRNFYTLGDVHSSFVWSAVMVTVLCALVYGAKRLKLTSQKFKTCFVMEIVLVVLFAAVALLPGFVTFSHFFTVHEQKTEIQSKVLICITQAENMFVEYEAYADDRKKQYKSILNNVVRSRYVNPGAYADFGFENNISPNRQLKNKMIMLHSTLFPSDYAEMKLTDLDWLQNAKNIVKSQMKITDVLEIVNSLDANTNNRLTQLVKFSSSRAPCEHVDNFSFDLSFDELKSHFNSLKLPSCFAIVAAVVLYAFMLFPYFVAGRHVKYPGYKELFTKRNPGMSRRFIITE
jgi:hypothetical protein